MAGYPITDLIAAHAYLTRRLEAMTQGEKFDMEGPNPLQRRNITLTSQYKNILSLRYKLHRMVMAEIQDMVK